MHFIADSSLKKGDQRPQTGGSATTQSSEATTTIESSKIQVGGNFNPHHFVDRIANIVTEKVTKNLQFRAAHPHWQNYEISEPTITSEVVTNQNPPPPPFSAPIKQNDLADQFDAKRLLSLIPKRFKKQAEVLLKAFDERAEELTFDSNGTIYIDATSLPGSNIFLIFPTLFKQTKNRKTLQGFDEVIEKLTGMGLAHLIVKPNVLPKVKAASEKPLSSGNSSAKNWWFLN